MSSEAAEILAAGREAIRREGRAVINAADQLDETFVEDVRRVLQAPDKVITTGAGTSGIVAARLAHLLAVSGTPSFFLSSSDALHGGMGAVTPTGTVIAFSKCGQSEEITQFVSRLVERHIHVIAVAERADSPFADAASSVVQIGTDPTEADPGGLIAMGSTLVAGAWGDALAVALMRLQRYQWSEVVHTHPAGIVGKQTILPEEGGVVGRERA